MKKTLTTSILGICLGASCLSSVFAVSPVANKNFVPDGKFLVVGQNDGGLVSLFSPPSGGGGYTQFGASFSPFGGSYRGGVSVAVGDLTGDGVADIVTAARSGGSEVKVFDGTTGSEIRSFFAYPNSFAGGVRVSVADVTGDGRDDIVTGTGPSTSASGHVKVFSGTDYSQIRDFFPFASGFLGGVNVAAGDINGDGRADIVVGAGAGGGPQVKVFDGSDNSLLSNFFAFQPSFVGGVVVGVGDFDGNAEPDLIIGQLGIDPFGLKVFEAAVPNDQILSEAHTGFLGGVFVGSLGYTAGNQVVITDAIGTTAFSPFDPSYTGGLNVAAIPEPANNFLAFCGLGVAIVVRRAVARKGNCRAEN